jgi:DNA repair protein SbcC/Rad50
MRPHRLRVQAFGAFAGTEEVTFDDLEGLFLLHGETGAGKTTLLDAIAFALYGRVPGERGNAKRLRSDHAAPGLATEVELEATIGARHLLITRKPEQERPKKSGTGATKEPASVRLDELLASGRWESKSTRVVEADQEIRDLMGMSADQFFQVVLLPQGQFAKFLHADAKDKEALLRKLFSTDRFRAVEDWLADRRRTTADDVKKESEALDVLMARVAQAAGVSLPDSVPAFSQAPSADPWQAAWAADLAVSVAVHLDEAVVRLDARKRDLEAALAAKTQADQLASRQHRRSDALHRQRGLDAAAPGITKLRVEAEAASRAAEAKADLDAVNRAADASATAQRTQAQARTAIPIEYVGAREASQEVLRAAEAEQRMQLGALDQLREVERQAAVEEKDAAAARARATKLDAEIEKIEAQARRHRDDRPRAMDAREAADRAVAALPTALDMAKTARQIAADSAAMVKERAKLDRLRESHLDAREQAVALHEEANRLHKSRIDGMSAELAANLFDGYECPVCGSLDHPNPKERTFDPVSREQEAAADAAAESAARTSDSAGQKVAACQAVITTLTKRLTEIGFVAAAIDTDAVKFVAVASQAEADAKRHEAEAVRIKSQAASQTDLQRQLEQLDRAIADLEAERGKLAERRGATFDEAIAADGRAAKLREELRAQLGDAADLDSALSATRRLADALAEASAADGEAARTAAVAREATVHAASATKEKGFAAIEEARAALRDARWRRETADQISRHEADVQAVASILADPDLDVALDPPAPVTETAAATDAAQQAHEAATSAHATARHTADQLADLKPLLDEKLAALAPLKDRADQIRQLADLAAGQGTNQYKMTLSSFVLAARLEEVAAAASERLLTMTAGRFSLAHSDARKGNAKAGLSLLACDSWTGIDRDTATLSGGETFLASLSLALGLADVVTAEAAGTPMEALFVDEGFGTLDEDTLDEVMNVLDGLREGGRIVGIVSHVAELRQRIPSRVHVAKGRHGSHVTVTGG